MSKTNAAIRQRRGRGSHLCDPVMHFLTVLSVHISFPLSEHNRIEFIQCKIDATSSYAFEVKKGNPGDKSGRDPI